MWLIHGFHKTRLHDLAVKGQYPSFFASALNWIPSNHTNIGSTHTSEKLFPQNTPDVFVILDTLQF